MVDCLYTLFSSSDLSVSLLLCGEICFASLRRMPTHIQAHMRRLLQPSYALNQRSLGMRVREKEIASHVLDALAMRPSWWMTAPFFSHWKRLLVRCFWLPSFESLTCRSVHIEKLSDRQAHVPVILATITAQPAEERLNRPAMTYISWLPLKPRPSPNEL